MLVIVLVMLVILVLAGVVVLYVAYPHRGEEVPDAPWLGDAMRKGVDALPTLDNQPRSRRYDAAPARAAAALSALPGRPARCPERARPVIGSSHG